MNSCFLWKGIMSCFKDFKQNIKFELGYGYSLRFWKDAWLGGKKTTKGVPNFIHTGKIQGVINFQP